MFAKIVHFVSDQSCVPVDALGEASFPATFVVAYVKNSWLQPAAIEELTQYQ
jgi:hypothetical protein